jgi:hypothetical protein
MADIRKIISEYPAPHAKATASYVECERRVLSNIAASKDAMAAIGRIAGDNKDLIEAVIGHCAIARALKQEFAYLVVKKRATAEQLQRHRQSIQDLHQLIPDHDALDRVIKSIEKQQAGVEYYTKRMLGVTRKSSTKTAAENAAIGWLAEMVIHNTGKPFARQVADLAEVAFDIGEITEDRVRELLKTRRKKSVD